MFPTHEKIAAEQLRRLMEFPPDFMLWNAYVGASWSAWMSLWGFDPQVWTKMFDTKMSDNGLASPTGSKPAEPVPANDAAQTATAEPGTEVKPMPDNEPVQPSFA